MEQNEPFDNQTLELDKEQLKAVADFIGADPSKCQSLQDLSDWYSQHTPQNIAFELLEDGYLTLVAVTPTTRIRCEGDIAWEELDNTYIWEEVVSALLEDLRFYDLSEEERQKDEAVSYEHIYRSHHFDAVPFEDEDEAEEEE